MRHRLTSLVLASSFFALVAGVAGWFWSQLFTNPIAHLTDQRHRVGTVACAALAGAVSGLLLSPARGDDGGPPRPSTARITAVLLVLGVVVGGVCGSMRSLSYIGIGVGCGFLYGILLTPAAAVVIPILRRFGQARRGSVVAWADSRALVATTGGVLGCTSCIAVFNAPPPVTGVFNPPRLVVALLIAAAVLVALALVVDMAVLARVERWASRLAVDDSSAPPDGAAPVVGHMDVGVGDELLTAPTPGTAYRGGGRLVASVAGDIDEARAVLRQSIRRGAVFLALLEGAAFAHVAVTDVNVAIDYNAWVCDDHHVEACRDAAILAERAGRPPREVVSRYEHACRSHWDEDSCNTLVLLQRQAGPPW